MNSYTWPRKGSVIGNKKVIATFDRGPFAYVITECKCPARTRSTQALGLLKRGKGLQCRMCYWEMRRKGDVISREKIKTRARELFLEQEQKRIQHASQLDNR